MGKLLLVALAVICMAGKAQAAGLQALDDDALAKVSGGDGIGFATHISLNDPTMPGAAGDSRFTIGYATDGKTTYLVIGNPHGTIDIAPMTLDVDKKPDGSDYLALTLPESVRYGNFGFDSVSAQSDAAAPVTGDLGHFSINGTVTMQGQLRLWAH